jgi:stress response protein SCP2
MWGFICLIIHLSSTTDGCFFGCASGVNSSVHFVHFLTIVFPSMTPLHCLQVSKVGSQTQANYEYFERTRKEAYDKLVSETKAKYNTELIERTTVYERTISEQRFRHAEEMKQFADEKQADDPNSMKKGEKVNLEEGITNVACSVKWTGTADLDGGMITFKGKSKFETCWYNNKMKGQNKAMEMPWDRTSQGTGADLLELRLTKLPKEVTLAIIYISLVQGGTFSAVSDILVEIDNKTPGQEGRIATVRTDGIAGIKQHHGLILAAFGRTASGGWAFKAAQEAVKATESGGCSSADSPDLAGALQKYADGFEHNLGISPAEAAAVKAAEAKRVKDAAAKLKGVELRQQTESKQTEEQFTIADRSARTTYEQATERMKAGYNLTQAAETAKYESERRENDDAEPRIRHIEINSWTAACRTDFKVTLPEEFETVAKPVANMATFIQRATATPLLFSVKVGTTECLDTIVLKTARTVPGDHATENMLMLDQVYGTVPKKFVEGFIREFNGGWFKEEPAAEKPAAISEVIYLRTHTGNNVQCVDMPGKAQAVNANKGGYEQIRIKHHNGSYYIQSVRNGNNLQCPPDGYTVNEKVRAKFFDGRWFDATVTAAHSNGTFDVKWCDNDSRDRTGHPASDLAKIGNLDIVKFANKNEGASFILYPSMTVLVCVHSLPLEGVIQPFHHLESTRTRFNLKIVHASRSHYLFGFVSSMCTSIGMWERWHIEFIKDKVFFIAKHTNKVLQCTPTGELKCANQNRQAYEAFQILNSDGSSAHALVQALESGGVGPAPTIEEWASKGAATQSSEYGSGYVAKNALDTTDSFSHTKTEDRAWWQVDLNEEINITSITIVNRIGGCQDRLSNFDVRVQDSTGATVFTKHFQKAQPTFEIGGINTTGRVVTVQFRGNMCLHMSGVKVFGFRAPKGSGAAARVMAAIAGVEQYLQGKEIQFNNGSWNVDEFATNRAILAGVAQIMRDTPFLSLTIHGLQNNDGSDEEKKAFKRDFPGVSAYEEVSATAAHARVMVCKRALSNLRINDARLVSKPEVGTERVVRFEVVRDEKVIAATVKRLAAADAAAKDKEAAEKEVVGWVDAAAIVSSMPDNVEVAQFLRLVAAARVKSNSARAPTFQPLVDADVPVDGSELQQTWKMMANPWEKLIGAYSLRCFVSWMHCSATRGWYQLAMKSNTTSLPLKFVVQTCRPICRLICR